MRYGDEDRESQNVEDRRSSGGFGGGRGGMRIPIQLGGPGGMSITSLLVIGAICLMLGINPLELLSGGGIPIGGDAPTTQQPLSPQDEVNARFVKRVLADTEDVWNRSFQEAGRKYEEPKLVMFRGMTPTACGTGDARMGPFYCPLDKKVYIDLVFFEELGRRFKAPGEFAEAYVVAHEVGHHVQTLLGVATKVREAQQRDPRRANEMQVRMELQADCLAGVWANRTNQMKQRLEPGDIESGLRAAAAIGDDTLQRQATGRVAPENFTHGSSAQRVRWSTAAPSRAARRRPATRSGQGAPLVPQAHPGSVPRRATLDPRYGWRPSCRTVRRNGNTRLSDRAAGTGVGGARSSAGGPVGRHRDRAPQHDVPQAAAGRRSSRRARALRRVRRPAVDSAARRSPSAAVPSPSRRWRAR